MQAVEKSSPVSPHNEPFRDTALVTYFNLDCPTFIDSRSAPLSNCSKILDYSLATTPPYQAISESTPPTKESTRDKAASEEGSPICLRIRGRYVYMAPSQIGEGGVLVQLHEALPKVSGL